MDWRATIHRTFLTLGNSSIVSYVIACDHIFAALASSVMSACSCRGFADMVMYIEACEAGSMFEGLLDDSLNIYTTTAANAHESSWATYCPGMSPAPPTGFTTCLGDLYSVSWMENRYVKGTLHRKVVPPTTCFQDLHTVFLMEIRYVRGICALSVRTIKFWVFTDDCNVTSSTWLYALNIKQVLIVVCSECLMCTVVRHQATVPMSGNLGKFVK